MKISSLRILSATLCCSFLIGSIAGAADLDTVYRRGETKGFAGQISAVTRNDVTVTQKVGNKEEKFPANEIFRIEFQGEPAMLNLARSNEASGRLQDAMAGYQEALGAANGDQLKIEINYLMARTLAKMAQADPSKASLAIEKLNSLTNTARDNYRYYPAQQLLAETALMVHDHVTAESAFDRLQQSPWNDLKMTGKIGTARTLLDQKKVGEAKALFDEVAKMPTNTPTEKAALLEAMSGQAECHELQNELTPAAEILQKVVTMATAEDNRILAQAYIQLGNVYAADGQKNKDAVLAYLHVDVIPTLGAQADLHAEALYHLAKLWPAVGHPDRGAMASERLQNDYPASEWTKKLAGGE